MKEKKEEMWHRKWTEEEKQRVRDLTIVSMWLDSYEDLFSDFDPRPFSQRAMSDDFISETKKVINEKGEEGIELKFLIPSAKRDIKQEEIINKRLKRHFKKQFFSIQKEITKLIKQGVFFILSGMLCMIIATLVFFYYQYTNLFVTFIAVFLEPAGWFLFWEGLNLVIFNSKKGLPELSFYEKMAKSKLSFLSY